MSNNIRLTSNDKQYGKVVYNASIVQNIVELAITEVEGTLAVGGKKSDVALRIDKDGVYAQVSVGVKYGYNVPDVAYRVQQSVKQSVENMTRFKVVEVDVHVKDVAFCAYPPVAEKEESRIEEDRVAESATATEKED